jgi:3-polyprenyl-4-hydroxybenzoate decarboxylase
MELTLAITGASGTIYAHRTLQLLAASGVVETINLIMSTTAATRLKAHPLLAARQSRGKAFVGLEQAGRDDRRSVLDGHFGGHRQRCGH